MSEATPDDARATPVAPSASITMMPVPAVPPTAFGAILGRERERQGLSVGDMATRLRLHINQVRALEAENLAVLPEAAYVRGFVRSYARALGIDPQAALADLNAKLPPGQPELATVGSGPAYAPGRTERRERLQRPVVIAGALAALLALGVIGWRATLAPPVPTPVAVALPPPLPAPVAPPAQDAGTTGGSAVAPAPATEAAPAVSPTDPRAQAAAAIPLVRLAFSGRSWVRVTAADGRVLIDREEDRGAEQLLDATLPLNVEIGNAPAVRLEFRGEPVDLGPYTRASVARLTLQ